MNPEPPHLGSIIQVGKEPEPCGLFVTGIVQRSGRHFDGRLWANIWHIENGTIPVMSVIRWEDPHWVFEERAFEKLDPGCKATIESHLALSRRFHPKA